MASTAAVIVLTGVLLLTQPIHMKAFNNETKFGTVIDLISTLSQSNMPKEILDTIPCEAVNPMTDSYIDCKELSDGIYQDPKTANCSEYFRCEQQQRINCSCGPELIFNAKLQACVIGNQKAPCPHLSNFGACFNKEAGFYVVPATNCKQYYKCQNGRRTSLECKPGKSFDTESSLCIEDSEVKCLDEMPQSDMSTSECTGKIDGKYAVPDSQNKRFYICRGELKMSEGTCLEGQLFYENMQKCSAPVEMSETGLEALKSVNCEYLVDGYYPDINQNCTRFFQCKAGRKLSEMTCPKGMRFDMDFSYCLDASQVSCFETRESMDGSVQAATECLSKGTGYYPVISSGCTQFIFCKNNQKLMELRCSAGEAFDASFGRCMNANFVHCNDHLPTESVTIDTNDVDCYNKSDDYYPDYASNCRKFYYCKNGLKTSELLCRNDDAFDAITRDCQPRATVKCRESNEEHPICSGKADGYYSDISNHCRYFHSCRGGQVVAELKCGPGELFDDGSKKCAPQTLVTCSSLQTVTHTQKIFGRICENKTDGFYPDYSSGCKRYFHCRTGHVAAEYVCTAGQLFDPITSMCLTEHCVSCSEDGKKTDLDNCNFKDDGYYPAYCNGCRSYYYCRNRLKMVNITCAAGHIFDTDAKVCTEEKFAICNTDIHQNSSSECRGRSDGFYLDSASGNCSTYFYCNLGVISKRYSCSNGTCFDENSGVCTSRLISQFNCSQVPDGYYMDPTSSCHQYFVCQNNALELLKCPGNMIFDINDLSCKSKRTSTCKMLREYECKGKEEGIYEDLQGNKQLFHICRNGKHVESGSCPLYSTFNKHQKSCVTSRPPSKPPTRSHVPSWTVGNRTALTNLSLFDCRKLENGFYPDVSLGCTKYYVCVDGQMIKSARCPSGQLFHIWKQVCRPREEVTCDGRGKHTPTGNDSSAKPSSFHFQFHNGCKNITLCFDSKQSFLTHCPMPSNIGKSHYQNKHYCKIGNIAERKSESDDSRSPKEQSTFDCRGKEDGYYTDPETACRKWHMCEASRGYTYECESGKAFNILHKRCDLAETITCAAQSWVYRNYSSARSLPSSFRSQTQEFRKQAASINSGHECGRKSDGIYIDLTGIYSLPSNACFNVYLCINEQVYSISCPFEPKEHIGEQEVMCKVTDDVKCMRDNSTVGRTATSVPTGLITQESVLHEKRLIKTAAAYDIMPNRGNFTCIDKEDGFYNDFNSNCKKFYVCHAGTAKEYTCPASLLFNSNTKSCDLPENVVCLLQAANGLTCPGNLTKLYPDHASGCQHYFGCIEGRFVHSTCPAGSLFHAKSLRCETSNTVLCTNTITVLEQDIVEAQASSVISRRLDRPTQEIRSTTRVPVTPAIETSSFDCSNKPDGFYPDHEQNCHVFYRCVHGKKFSHYCQSGQLFSSQLQSCDFQENVKCDEQTFVTIKPNE